MVKDSLLPCVYSLYGTYIFYSLYSVCSPCIYVCMCACICMCFSILECKAAANTDHQSNQPVCYIRHTHTYIQLLVHSLIQWACVRVHVNITLYVICVLFNPGGERERREFTMKQSPVIHEIVMIIRACLSKSNVMLHGYCSNQLDYHHYRTR